MSSLGKNSRSRCRRVTPQTHMSLGGRKVRIPSWFHGLLDRGVAEDLLMKSPVQPKQGLFLVRQSSNRGGCFVISVCTGFSVNHYLIETLESMFYVKRENGDERGRDIQACDLLKLVECYKRLPLDVSGLTLHQPLSRTTPIAITTSFSPTPSSKDNHNYIPLYVDHRYYVGKEDFQTNDLDAVSFGDGEPITILIKESKHWWFGFNSKGDLGYFPSALLLPLYDVDPEELCGRLSEDERVELREFARSSDDDRGLEFQVHRVLDSNSNHILTEMCREQFHSVEQRANSAQRQKRTIVSESNNKSVKGAKHCQNEIYVSSEYITACLQNHKRKLLDNFLQSASIEESHFRVPTHRVEKSEVRESFRECQSNSESMDTLDNMEVSKVTDVQIDNVRSMHTEDMEWVFTETMNTALLEPEQLVPDMDSEVTKMGHTNHVHSLEDELWMNDCSNRWGLSKANVLADRSRNDGRVPQTEEENLKDGFRESMIQQVVSKMENVKGNSNNKSQEYDPIVTYLRLCDCSSRPAPT